MTRAAVSQGSHDFRRSSFALVVDVTNVQPSVRFSISLCMRLDRETFTC